MVLSSASTKAGEPRAAKIPGNGGSQVTPPPPPVTRTSPLTVLAKMRTPSDCDARMSPGTRPWGGPAGSSAQGPYVGSQPSARTPPDLTVTSPRTVRLEAPDPATSLWA